MPELNVQKFLREVPGGLIRLQEPPYNLKVRPHPEFANLVSFCYDQIDSPKADPIVLECRGLILDSQDNWNVVAFPFTRFFNDGEFQAAKIDWNTARVYEKVDGTLIIMYWYEGKWRIATRGSPNASGSVGFFPWIENGSTVPLTYERLFWRSAEHWLKGLSKSGEFDSTCTYMWELTSPLNRVVCDYTEIGPVGQCIDGNNKLVWVDTEIDNTGYAHDGSRITLIGIRNNITFKEYDIKYSDAHYKAKYFPLRDLQEVITAASKLNPLRQEGFVVVDGDYNRVKIKSPVYVAFHHLRDGNPRKRLMEIIQSGEKEEMMAYKILDEFPAEKKMYEEMLAEVESLILQTEQIYDRIKDIELQKDFALEALKSPMPYALFGMRKGLRDQKTIRQIILSCPTQKLLDMLKGK